MDEDEVRRRQVQINGHLSVAEGGRHAQGVSGVSKEKTRGTESRACSSRHKVSACSANRLNRAFDYFTETAWARTWTGRLASWANCVRRPKHSRRAAHSSESAGRPLP